jgi:hypothetical protein
MFQPAVQPNHASVRCFCVNAPFRHYHRICSRSSTVKLSRFCRPCRMFRRKTVIVVIHASTLVACLGALSGAPRPPQVTDFPVRTVYRGGPALPKFGDPAQYHGTDLRCFRGNAESYAGRRANFAGHFVIGACTCGSGCHYLFMWDAANGRSYGRLPIGAIDTGPYGLGSVDRPVEYRGEYYRVDSSLLIVEGSVEDTCDCSTRYYRWDGARFKPLLKIPAKTPPDCAK